MILDGNGGYITRCDWCGKVMDYSAMAGHEACCNCEICVNAEKEQNEIQRTLWDSFFVSDTGRKHNSCYGLPAEFPHDTCRQCAIKLTPYVQRFAELWLVNIFNNRLKGAIREQRKKSG